MVHACIRDGSVSCPFSTCIGGTIEGCNFSSGRYSRRLSRGSVINFAVLRGAKFVELRGSSSF